MYVTNQRIAPAWGIMVDMEKCMSMSQVKELRQLWVR